MLYKLKSICCPYCMAGWTNRGRQKRSSKIKKSITLCSDFQTHGRVADGLRIVTRCELFAENVAGNISRDPTDLNSDERPYRS